MLLCVGGSSHLRHLAGGIAGATSARYHDVLLCVGESSHLRHLADMKWMRAAWAFDKLGDRGPVSTRTRVSRVWRVSRATGTAGHSYLCRVSWASRSGARRSSIRPPMLIPSTMLAPPRVTAAASVSHPKS